MRVLHVAASYLPASRYGGTIVSVHALCRALSARGHHVEVYTTSVDGESDSAVAHDVPVDVDGVSVTYFKSPSARRLYYAPAMRHALRAAVREFDLLHTHGIYLWPLWTAAGEARRAGVPYVMSPRGMLEKALVERKSALWKSALIGFVERRNLEAAAAVHVTSPREAEEASAFGFSVRRYAEIPNGVDLDDRPDGVPVSARINTMIDEGPYVLFLGRVNWKKGLDRLIASLAHAPEVRLIIAGNDEEQYQPTLDAIAGRAGVRDRVVFAGAVAGAEKAALLKASRAVVLPSYSENFGNVILEAMAAARPVIVTRDVGAAALVEQSGAGLIVGGSREELGGALSTLFADVARGDAMGERGRRAASEWSWDAVALRMEALYDDIRCRAC